MVRIGINGMGRIGRAFVRQAMAAPGIDVVAVNDVTDAETIARLLRRDSTWGPWEVPVGGNGNFLVLGDQKVAVSSMSRPELLPWREHGVELVVEATGHFRDRQAAARHLQSGARRVLLSAPGKGVDATLVMGVNDHTFDPDRHVVVSNASCTTNCVAPMVKVLHEEFGIRQGFMTTVHAYTNDQNLLDGPHRDPRRARAAAVNIVPTSTGAAKAVGEVLPAVAGRLDGVALRVPVVDGSLVDLAVVLDRDATREEVNEAFRRAAETGPLAGRLRYETEPLVSSDVVLDPASCVLDAGLTQAAGNVVKAFGWYDNEWGYTARLLEMAALVGGGAEQ